MTKFTEEQKAWLTALESGKYAQGTGLMRSKSNKFCCLGVAYDLFGTGWVGPIHHYYETTTYDCHVLHRSVYSKLHLQTDNGLTADGETSLTSMNDNGMSFAEIAAFIRANPEQVFSNFTTEGSAE